jgi:hypothetical protein
MEFASADFFKYSVVLVLRKDCRVIRSVRSSALPGLDVQGPEYCLRFMTASFGKLAEDHSQHQRLIQQDALYR